MPLDFNSAPQQAVPAVVAASNVKPTDQQQAFIDFNVSGQGHGGLVARAGTGKTSTIILTCQAIARSNPDAEITVCAFSKDIAKEVKAKLVKAGMDDWKRYQASTVHSMGLGLLKFRFKSELDEKKVAKIIDALAIKFADENPYERNTVSEYRSQIAQLVSRAKGEGVGFFDDMPVSSVKTWADIAAHYDLADFEQTSDLDAVIAIAQKVYDASLADTQTIDYDDMILFPLIKQVSVRFGRDYIFVDEAQDLSRVRQALVKKFLKRNGRLMIIGDDRQAIFGFSGADAKALHNLQTSMNATMFPLTVTWRCPKNVVTLARTIVSDIEAAPNAADGEVIYTNVLPAEKLAVGDAILCRKTAPLISLAYSLIRSGKPARVEGRDIGKGLLKLVNRWKVSTIAAFLEKLDVYQAREIQKARAKDNEARVQTVTDQCETLQEICSVCIAKKQTRLDDVRAFIDFIFVENEEGEGRYITLATYHRSKGREWHHVYLWDHNRCCPSPYAKQEWQKAQEANLAYVAFTRAQKTLTFITPPQA